MKQLLKYLPLIFMIDACVDPLDVALPTNLGGLVFDGLITNDPGPYQVKIFYAGPFDGFSLQKSIPERKAVVTIISDAGESEKLIEVQPGVYETSAGGIQGAVGRSYGLQVKIASGKTYATDLQKMTPGGVIDKIYLTYEKGAIVPNNQTTPNDAFSIWVDAHGDQDESNLFRWRWANTFKAKSFPERHYTQGRNGIIPSPLPCSGYVSNGVGISYVFPCECCICYATEYNTNSVISENRLAKDKDFKKVLVAKLPFIGMRFYEKYHIAIDQLSISPDVYEFWKLAEALQKSTGSLFQPNSVKVRGNIQCTSNPEETALGIFSVSGITKKIFTVYREDVPIPIPPIDTIMYDCRDSFINATTTKPTFW